MKYRHGMLMGFGGSSVARQEQLRAPSRIPLIDLMIGRWNVDYDDTDNFTYTLFHSGSGGLKNYFSSRVSTLGEEFGSPRLFSERNFGFLVSASYPFDRFRRVDQDGFRGEAALGLGLPLTRQFIEGHGGTVELQSKEGAGTTVTLTIPRGER